MDKDRASGLPVGPVFLDRYKYKIGDFFRMNSNLNVLSRVQMRHCLVCLKFKPLLLASMMALLYIIGTESAAYAQSFPVTASITADNYFRLCHGDPTTGNPNWLTCTAAYDDWKTAHTLTINVNATDDIYIAAWSDDAVAQGLLAEIVGYSNANLQWEVHSTANNRNTLAQEPTTNHIESNITGPWNPVTLSNNLPNGGASFTNGTAPWPWISVSGISSSIPWMWYDSKASTSLRAPFMGGLNHGEYLIFRLPAKKLVVFEPDPICSSPGDRVMNITTSGATPWGQPNNALIDEQGNSSWWTAWAPGYPNPHSAILNLPKTVNIREVRAHASSLQGSSGTLDVKVNGTTYALNLINPGTWDSFVSFSPPIPASQVELTRNLNTENIDELYICGSMVP